MSSTPPFTLSPAILTLCTQLAERVGRLAVLEEQSRSLHLRRLSRIRTVQGSLAIEGNTLSEAQITAILEGKRVLAPPGEIQEAHNALSAYDRLESWNPHAEADLLAAHRCLMAGLLPDAGRYRQSGEAVASVAAGQASPHVVPHVTPQVAALLSTLQGEMSRDQLMTELGLSDRKSFTQRYLRPALQQGLIEMTLPDKPRSRLQRYRLTAAGQQHGH